MRLVETRAIYPAMDMGCSSTCHTDRRLLLFLFGVGGYAHHIICGHFSSINRYSFDTIHLGSKYHYVTARETMFGR